MSHYAPAAASGHPDSTGSEVEYRLSRRYRRPMLRRFAVMLILTVIFVLVRHLALLGVLAYVTAPLAVIFGAIYLWQGRFATRVTSRGIKVRGYFNHFVPWQEVRSIEVTAFGSGLAQGQDFGSQVYFHRQYGGSGLGAGVDVRRVTPNGMAHLASIKLVRAGGRKLRLRAPVVSGWADDPDFDDKARQLRQLCAQYGGGPAGPPPG